MNAEASTVMWYGADTYARAIESAVNAKWEAMLAKVMHYPECWGKEGVFMNKIMELADDYARVSVNLECGSLVHGTIGAETIAWVDEARAALVSEVERMEAESEAVGRSNKYLAAQLEAMQAEIAALREDAERYRWLVEMEMLDKPSADMAKAFSTLTGSALDAAIDSARGIKCST